MYHLISVEAYDRPWPLILQTVGWQNTKRTSSIDKNRRNIPVFHGLSIVGETADDNVPTLTQWRLVVSGLTDSDHFTQPSEETFVEQFRLLLKYPCFSVDQLVLLLYQAALFVNEFPLTRYKFLLTLDQLRGFLE